MLSLTVVIPAFNEEEGIQDVLRALSAFFAEKHLDGHIIVVDDGSTDATAAKASSVQGIQVIRQPYNKGYGASLKAGIMAATSEWCVTYDADGQHQPANLEAILPSMTDRADMVIGKREGYKGPWIRQPGKRLLSWVANYLTEKNIPDLNSGLRGFRRSQFLKYMHLFPDGFSLSTTSTVCFFKERLNVLFVPITIKKRVGKSTVRARDGIKTFMLIMRLIMLFSPLRIFLPASGLFFILMLADIVYEFTLTGKVVNQSSVALLTLAGLTFFFGLLADQIAAVRRELGVARR